MVRVENIDVVEETEEIQEEDNNEQGGSVSKNGKGIEKKDIEDEVFFQSSLMQSSTQ